MSPGSPQSAAVQAGKSRATAAKRGRTLGDGKRLQGHSGAAVITAASSLFWRLARHLGGRKPPGFGGWIEMRRAVNFHNVLTNEVKPLLPCWEGVCARVRACACEKERRRGSKEHAGPEREMRSLSLSFCCYIMLCNTLYHTLLYIRVCFASVTSGHKVTSEFLNNVCRKGRVHY